MEEFLPKETHQWLSGEQGNDGQAPTPPSDEQLVMIAQAADRLQVPKGRSMEDMWSALEEKIDWEEEENTEAPVIAMEPTSRKSVWAYASVAAAIAILMAGWFFWLSNDAPNTRLVASDRTQELEIQLPDQSMVNLNAASTLEYAENWEESREVRLTGEAFFEVTHGDKFSVVTDKGTVTVLGTEFNVAQRGEAFEVACLSGKVRVTTPDGETVILTAGQQTSLAEGNLKEATAVEQDFIGSWRTGVFRYQATELGIVLEEIERQYDVSFVGAIPEGHYTGSWTDNNLEETLQLVLLPMGLEYEIQENKTVRISE